MTRRRIRQIVAIVILLMMLAAVSVLAVNYRGNKKVSLNIDVNTAEKLDPPQYLYSFAGEGKDVLQRPLGLLNDDGRVYVTEGIQGKIYVFRATGEFIRTFGDEQLTTPLYVARNPKNGNLYVSDRRERSIFMYTPEGKYIGEFDPKLPKDQLPKVKVPAGVQWAPVALDFASDGTMYVTEILRGHRLLIFGPDGAFKKSVGDAALVLEADKAPEFFQFPNSVKVHGKEVWVADSNNRRVQVFDREGKYLRLVVTDGLPRGMDFLPRWKGQSSTSPERFVVIDTLAHDGSIFNVNGDLLVKFGEQGTLEGQFAYPNDVSVGPDSKIYITDTSNGRVQVWGWPAEAAVIPQPETPFQWALCALPLLLLPLLWLLKVTEFFVTRDFVLSMFGTEELAKLPHRRRRWVVTPEDYEELKDIKQGEIDLAELLNPVEHSESDARRLMEKLEIDEHTAVVLATAQRARYTVTEDPELRRLARVIELDVMNREEFLERFDSGRAKKAESES